MKHKVLLFGGTSEGVELARGLTERGYVVTVSVATEYGALMLSGIDAEILTGRLDKQAMVKLLPHYEWVIDATHPYAAEVTVNIQAAAEETGVPYQRIVRPEGALDEGWLTVPTPQAAADLLQTREGNILLTTGSKDLAVFATLPDYQERVWVRILASEASLHQALTLGYPPNHVIAMHGPFSKELNLALLHQFDIRTVVTKRSGRAGGFWEKADATREAGATLLVIDRPLLEEGLTVADLLSGLPPRTLLAGGFTPRPLTSFS